MKNLCILIAIITFIGCSSSKEKINNPEKGKTYSEIVQNELKSGKRNDKIFLGFSFGMTKTDFDKRLQELIDSSIIYKNANDSNVLTYDLVVDQITKLQCTFSPDFYENKLYKLGVSAKSQDSYISPEIIAVQLQMAFVNKYGIPDIEQPMLIVEDFTEYIWINGNRKIEILCGLDDGRIYYEDLSVLELKNKIEEKKSKEDIKQSQNNI